MRKFMISLVIGILVTITISSHFKTVETALANSVVRLHILANSNSDDDQALKLKVRDAVIKNYGDMFLINNDITYAKKEIATSLDDIKKTAEEEIQKNGYNYDVKVSFGKSDFPTKIYNNITLPSGTYEALKVEIGNAEGHNWWCVMFPPMCFVDGGVGNMDDESIKVLKNTLTDEEFSLISSEKNIPVKVEFKLYEMWQEGKSRIKTILKNN